MTRPNPVLELMEAHRTVRRFRAGEVPDELVERVVSAARFASTSSHVQAYACLRLRDPEKRARLVELTGGQPQVASAGAFFVVCADQRRHELVAARAAAPFVANLETFLVGVIDAALFAQNLALGFESEGLGVCFIGGLRNRLPEADALLELPHGVLPLFGLCVGEPDGAPAPRPRLPLAAVLFEDRYPADDELLARIADHDREMAAYYAARGHAGRDWSGGIRRKFARPAREHLRAFYEGKGARLA